MANKNKKSRPTAFLTVQDASGVVIRETNVDMLMSNQEVAENRGKLSESQFPSKALVDALTIHEIEALARYVQGCLIPANSLKTTNLNPAGGGGGDRPTPVDNMRKQLAMAGRAFVYERLPLAHQRAVERFVELCAMDVGTSKERRRSLRKKVITEGKIIVARQCETRSLAGWTGYMRAIAQEISEFYIEFDIRVDRKRREQREKVKRNTQAITEYARRLNEYEGHDWDSSRDF